MRRNPAPPEHRLTKEEAIQQFYEVLLPDPDPASMEIAKDLCEEYGLTLVELGEVAAKYGFENVHWSDTRGYADIDRSTGAFVLSQTRAPFRAVMRAPKLGDRGWWVQARTPEAALAEVLQEGGNDQGEIGWLALDDYDFTPDENGMVPITLEYDPEFMSIGWGLWRRPPGKYQIPRKARGSGYVFVLYCAYRGIMWDETRKGISGLSAPEDLDPDYDPDDMLDVEERARVAARNVDARRRRMPNSANLLPAIIPPDIANEKAAIATAVKLAWACGEMMKVGKQRGLSAESVAALFRKLGPVDFPPASIVNPWEVESEHGGSEPFAREEDAETEAEDLRRRGVRGVELRRTRPSTSASSAHRPARGNPSGEMSRDQALLAFRRVIREPGVESMEVAQDIVLQYRLPLVQLSEQGRNNGHYILSPAEPGVQDDRVDWEVEKWRPTYSASVVAGWAYGIRYTWHGRDQWLVTPGGQAGRYLKTDEAARRAAAADAWAVAKQMKQLQVDEAALNAGHPPGTYELGWSDVHDQLKAALAGTYKDKTPPEVYELRGTRESGAPITKKRTYKESADDIWHALQRAGWTLSSPTLKVPHATSPNGWLRLWFKPQTVHASTSGSMSGTARDRLLAGRTADTHTLGNARAIAYDLDIRTLTPSQFLDEVKQRYPQGFE